MNDITRVRQHFEQLLAEYKTLLAIRNQQVLGNTASLYSITNDDLLRDTDLASKLKKMMLVTVLVIFVALMFASLVALVRKLPGKHEPETTTE